MVEDTDRTLADVRVASGPGVSALVAEIPDDKSLPRAERKRRRVIHAPAKSPGAERIKFADKASSLAALADPPPAGWEAARLRDCVAWTRAVAAGLAGADPVLAVAFAREAARAEAAMGG